MTTPAMALGLEIGAHDLRVIQLNRSGGAAAVTGYAAVGRPVDDRLGAGIRQLLEALGPPADAAVMVAHDPADHGLVPVVVDALTEAGASEVEPIETAEAIRRAVGPTPPESTTGFIGCPIPAGLLNAHAQLEIDDLAPAVGAALHGLGLGHEPSDDEIAAAVAAAAVTAGEDEIDTDYADRLVDDVDRGPERLAATLAAERRATESDADHERTPPVGVGAAAAASTRLEVGESDEAARAVRPLSVVLAFVAVIALGLLAFVLFGSSGSDDVADTATVTSTVADEDERDDTGDADSSDGTSNDGDDAAADDESDLDEVAVGDDAEPIALPEPTTEPEPTASATTEPDARPDDEAAPGEEAEPETEPSETDAEPDPLEDLPPLSELPERGAVFVAAEQRLYLRGPVTAEEGAVLEARAIEVLGPERVVNEYLYRPDAPPVTEGTVRVEQAVLFETGSAVIAEEFEPTLELGVLVMTLNPQVTMIVEGHTDAVGSEAANQVLSEARAQSVVDYLVGRGVTRERLVPVGFGESEPIADNATAAGRQLNRRIEVDLLDLISPRPDEAEG